MIGTIVNTVAVIGGAVVGAVFQKAISERFKVTVMQGIGLSVCLIGMQMALQSKNPLIVVASLVLGGILGEAVAIEAKLERFGKWLESKVGSHYGDVAKAFVTASLIYCVGAMAIMGSLQDGLTGDASVLFVKAMLDGITAIILASTLGIGVALSALPLFVYQGAITMTASYIQPFLQHGMIAEMTAVGGLLITGIGTNILGVTRLRVGNLLPGILFAVFGAGLFPPR
ncbi:membrane protein, putative [Heliomicrobium modesticaldum Ice1]|uniref:Membrane protein, putative n=1 Tax=Heliobacterium modesticaldum (strain ATCC 51547 / Ice1) TaxID=498761 RepID=B0TAB0_HELMI|nr:DUF554 domain-containing protein [Heliomicrobium modesticaldum]ABZ83647.1 membrane protein, putative [Heliomicrobium modesticaldum Ice1]